MEPVHELISLDFQSSNVSTLYLNISSSMNAVFDSIGRCIILLCRRRKSFIFYTVVSFRDRLRFKSAKQLNFRCFIYKTFESAQLLLRNSTFIVVPLSGQCNKNKYVKKNTLFCGRLDLSPSPSPHPQLLTQPAPLSNREKKILSWKKGYYYFTILWLFTLKRKARFLFTDSR
jgi:hypothetical protein